MTAPFIRPRVYLAGPDVFFPNQDEVFARLRARCEELGMVGVAPTDGGVSEGFEGTTDQLAQRIYEGNVELLASCDAVAANLVSFRGTEVDTGTAFEVGFAVAMKKPVVGYGVPAGDYSERVAAAVPVERDERGVLREVRDHVHVEDLGQRLNLMLSRSVGLADTAEEAIRRLAEHFRGIGHLRAAA